MSERMCASCHQVPVINDTPAVSSVGVVCSSCWQSLVNQAAAKLPAVSAGGTQEASDGE